MKKYNETHRKQESEYERKYEAKNRERLNALKKKSKKKRLWDYLINDCTCNYLIYNQFSN